MGTDIQTPLLRSSTTSQTPKRRPTYLVMAIRAAALIAAVTLGYGVSCTAASSPPDPEPIHIVELPLPPVAPSDKPGSCTPELNPNGTGCIAVESNLQGGGFLPDGNHVLATVNFTGAAASPDPSSIYAGMQLIIVRTNGTTFPNGDPWKCITCGTPDDHNQGNEELAEYPQSFKDGRRAIAGKSIVDCGKAQLASPQCTPDKVHVYPIWWEGGTIRELRLHPDNVHLGFNSFTQENGALGQFGYFGRLRFNPSPTTGKPLTARYEVVNVTRLFDPDAPQPFTINGSEIKLNHSAVSVGELRGFSGSGKEVTYIGYQAESSNWDIFAADLTTGNVRRITQHPEYVDPVDISPDDKWTVVLDTRGTDRQMWLSGMRDIPPITDLITSDITSATRNNRQRRFFQPWLIDHDGDRGSYFGQKINAAGDGTDGAINDPNWNARADPRWSPDGTQIMYYQALVQAPSCGGMNPLPCPVSTAPGGRVNRLMLATLTDRTPLPPQPVASVPEFIPWGVPYNPEDSAPKRYAVSPGAYALNGKVSGIAKVKITGNNNIISGVAVKYTNFSNDGVNTLVGTENVTVSRTSISAARADWYSDLTSTGDVKASRRTGPGGFHLEIDSMTNIFNANGTMTTAIDGVVYKQPANGT
ncbi:TolB family protein [Aspergillus puulaauensis]|uniref:Saponin hydrolase n=1 Tax=Aspergillus puulaauensis TaxID=1220207 RepID=A0A7R8AM30_9EURO|nr:uncharacterized protein APUU_40380S [Aspergillus puulaauensis]BCS23936.1 hypothetical protein APUU_40380S [Aspergillus puulaauensis]